MISKRMMIMMISTVLFFSMLEGLSAQSRLLSVSPKPSQVILNSNGELGFETQYQVGTLNLKAIQTRGGTFDELSLEGWSFTNKVGEPKLPMLRKIIAVPLGAEVRYTINSQDERQFEGKDSQLLHRIIPAQASVSKSADPASLRFELNEAAYKLRSFTEQAPVQIDEIGIMRGVRIFSLDFYPVRYNPVEQSLRVIENLSIRVEFVHPDLIGTADLLARTGSYEFDALYANTIFNWQTDTRTSLVRYPTKMLILCPPSYVSTLQSFVDWKKQQGYNVIVTTVGTGGTVANTAAAIKTYMTSVWSSATAGNPAPTYLLIVGDTSSSGNNIIASAAQVSSPSSSHITDNFYVRLSGTDYVPEMYYGRFSCSTATELTDIINKTITFEKTQMIDLSYLGNVVMIAGADPTYGPTHGNGQINYGTANYFNSSQGISSNTYLYPASASSDATIIANANAGRGYINYTAHGSETSWADPTFTVSNVNSMTNTGKYGVMVGNCCLTNAFNTNVCFGESIIRKANAGGVAYIGGTNNSYWDEDYWWGVGAKGTATGTAPAYDATKLGAYDAMFHAHTEAQTDWATSLGETNHMGNLAVVQGGSSYQNYYWEIYSIMGDPSLMPYYGIPTTNNASFPTNIPIGATSITVTATAYTRVGLSMGGTIYGSGIVPASGSLNLTITPFTTTGTASLVLTAQDKITRIENITISSGSGPFLNVSANTYSDQNNNIAEYNESGRFTPTFTNVGTSTASNITATLSCSTVGISITDGTETIASLAAGSSSTITNAFSFTVAGNIVNQLSAAFTITMVSGTNSWVHNFSQVLNAPALSFGSITISDPAGNNNGRIDPGESFIITMPLNNTGAASSPAGSATLSSPTTGITINTGSAAFNAITALGSSTLSFAATASASITIGSNASFVFNATAGAYTATKTETAAVGLITETFESGNFASYPWIMGSYPWTIDNSTHYAGAYAAKSGTITHSQSTTMELTRIVTGAGNVSFYYKVSSETGYDYLKFYIDGTIQNGNGFSGTVDWTQASYPLSTGTHVMKWEYMKDVSDTSGSDCAWVDNIVFPASTNLYTYYPPQNPIATPGNSFVTLAWQAPAFGTPTGYKVFKNSSLLTTVTGLTYNDTAVTNGVTYSYYLKALYSTGESVATATVSASPNAVDFVTVGTGTASNATNAACPINVYYQSLHGQSVYLASELTTAGLTGPINITQIGFNVTGLPTLAMPNFIVRMGHTSSTNVASWISTGLTTVYSSASYQPASTGWNMLTLSTPFIWNGTGNIVIDTAYGLIGSWTQTGTTQYSTVTSGYRYLQSDTVDETSLFTGGSTSTLRPNVKFGVVSSSTGALITVNPTSLPFGDVATGSSGTMQFSIQNTGDETLSGTITTPTGYTVALSAARATEFGSLGIKNSRNSRNSLSFSVNAGATKTYILTFNPTLVAAYNGNVVIASNAANSATVNLAVTGNGYDPNHAPTINLPASFSFDKNGSLVLDFSAYVSDADNDPLTLSSACGVNVCSSITGLSVTLSALQNWTGTETISFTVSDGSASALDTVPVIVLQVTTPGWTPVNYPNNSATIYGTATIDMTPCSLNDMVGAFVGTECRGMAEVTTNSGTSYVTLLVSLASENETVSFKIYDYSAATTYQVMQTQNLSYGQVVGNPVPLAINAVTIIGPLVNIDPLSLAFGPVEAGSTGMMQFIISNPGDQDLIGSIETPAGYSVALASGRSDDNLLRGKSDRNSLGFSIAGASSKTYNLSFSPTTATSFNGNVTLSTNVPGSATLGITVSGSGYIEPTISIDENSLTADLLIAGADTDSFTISNSGSQDLTFSLEESPVVSWFSALPAAGTISGSANNLITGSFSAEGLTPGLYQTTLLVNSNDPDTPQLSVTVELNVANTQPVINLPETFAFDLNTSLTSDFSAFVSDADLHNLTIAYSGNTHISVVIDGLNVSFSAAEYWFGSEAISFSVFDGFDYAYDTVTVSVNLNFLARPVINSISKTASGIELTWSPVTNASLYRVYRSFDPYGEFTDYRGITSLTSFVDEATSDPDRVFYRVIAVNE